MHHIDQEIDRFQFSMMDLESMVDQNSYPRLVDLFVEILSLKKLRIVLNLSAKIEGSEADLESCFERKQRLRSPVNRYNILIFN
jgi:hypothetical protein